MAYAVSTTQWGWGWGYVVLYPYASNLNIRSHDLGNLNVLFNMQKEILLTQPALLDRQPGLLATITLYKIQPRQQNQRDKKTIYGMKSCAVPTITYFILSTFETRLLVIHPMKIIRLARVRLSTTVGTNPALMTNLIFLLLIIQSLAIILMQKMYIFQHHT